MTSGSQEIPSKLSVLEQEEEKAEKSDKSDAEQEDGDADIVALNEDEEIEEVRIVLTSSKRHSKLLSASTQAA